jgi:DNA-binding transcriptional LysR family regulator
MDLDLRKVRYFLAVADELNFGRAAERLHVAQPVLSRQIAALERDLHVQLFERSSRGTRLTPAGAALLEEARTLLGRATAWQRRARLAARGRSHLTIGFMPGIIITAATTELLRQFPELTIDVVRTGWDDQVAVLHDGRVDASFVRLPVADDGLVVVPLFEEPRVVACAQGHPLASRADVTLADVAEFDLLQPPDSQPEWRDAVRARRPSALQAARDDLPVVRTVEEKLEHVASGRGIVLLPESTAMFYSRPDVVYRYVADLPPTGTALAYEASRGNSPELVALARAATRTLAAPDQAARATLG